MRALHVPQDPAKPVALVDIDDYEDYRTYIGPVPSPARFDRDALMYVDDLSRYERDINARATEYALERSDAAKQGRTRSADGAYALYGEVLITGVDGDDVPERIILAFGGQELLQGPDRGCDR